MIQVYVMRGLGGATFDETWDCIAHFVDASLALRWVVDNLPVASISVVNGSVYVVRPS